MTENTINKQDRPKQDRPKSEWIEDKVFTDQSSGLCVGVQKLPLFHPRYSVFIGRMGERGVNRFIPIFSQGRGKITVTRVHEVVIKLLQEAEDYIWSELQYHEDRIIERKQDFEQRSIDKEKHKPKVGISGGPGSGKTERDREKRRTRVSAK